MATPRQLPRPRRLQLPSGRQLLPHLPLHPLLSQRPHRRQHRSQHLHLLLRHRLGVHDVGAVREAQGAGEG